MKPQPKNKPIRLKGKAYTKFRKEVHDHYNGMCAKCGAWSPFTINGVFDVWTCGHVSHVKSRGAGGSDILDNVKWHCYACHSEHHGPRWKRGRL